MFSKLAMPTLIGLLTVLSTAQAHHSGAPFEPEKQVRLTGVVKTFQWNNPHCYIQLLVPDEKGSQAEWSLEMAAPIYLYNLGWRPSTLKAGDQITATVSPLRSGEKGGLVREVLDAGGARIGRKP
jgi:hypothetical protein